MNLLEALALINAPIAPDAPLWNIFLAVGFTPLHLRTYLLAQLRRNFPCYRIEIDTGLFGDLAGNIERAKTDDFVAVAVVVEWSDIDPRLGTRNLGTWRADSLGDILESSERQAERLKQAITAASARTPCIVALPSLPLPPLFPQKSIQFGNEEARLRRILADFAISLSGLPGVRVVSAQALDEASPLGSRHDVRAEIMTGLPYTLSHCEGLAQLIAELIENPMPKKGLITDLDDTLWLGILGEAGVDHIAWDLAGHALPHGLYQQLLESLASAGVLLGIASKNDLTIANKALDREDLLVSRNSFFPIECNWSNKSESVRRILKAWNISADAVVFVDDSPMEIAEIQAAFPGIECRLFPKNDPPAVLQLLRDLRNCFGKTYVSKEDSLRLDSIRSTSALQESTSQGIESQDDFLKSAGAILAFEAGGAEDLRAFELINKTNQFNLNGKRLTEAEWTKYLSYENSFLLSVQYEDKYGKLGEIAALLGRQTGERIAVDYWVLSCRAFSRRIEHQCLKYLFEKFHAQEVVFDYQTTERNAPLRDFFTEISALPLASPLQMKKENCFSRLPLLFHTVQETVHG